MDKALLSLRDLVCGFAEKPVLRVDEAEVHAGDIVGIIGTNGSGKSTLLRTLVGELVPIQGEIRVSGSPISHRRTGEIARHLALVPQNESPAFPFTARQLVATGRFARSGKWRDTAEDGAAVDRSLQLADASMFASRRMTELSGGERQRVFLARALAQEAPILLLDEPMANLDLEHQALLTDLLASKSACQASIAAVHDLNWAKAHCTKLWVLHQGRLAYSGAPSLLTSEVVQKVFRVKGYFLDEPLPWLDSLSNQ